MISTHCSRNIQALMKDDMSPVEKKALYYGIHALLMTKDERSQP